MLQTKQDYLNCLAMNPQEGKEELRLLLNSRFTWTNTMVFDILDCPTVLLDDTHRIIGEGDECYYQEYLEDNTAKLFRIGFTVEEVERLINEG